MERRHRRPQPDSTTGRLERAVPRQLQRLVGQRLHMHGVPGFRRIRAAGWSKQMWSRATSKVREELLCEEEGYGTHEKTRCRRRDGAEYCAHGALDEPPSQRSDEDCDEGGHHPNGSVGPDLRLRERSPWMKV